MPKMKSKSGAKKRFKVRKSGTIGRSQQGHRHFMRHKSHKQNVKLRKRANVSKANEKTVKEWIQG